MGSSANRHWPSMFKSKPTITTHQDHPWLTHNGSNHVLSSSSSSSHRSSPYTTSGCEERSTPEPKPRWNPKPEQIRILESIFNSGMVNPPRDLIKRIRIQLQEYGQVGDANVFYWFQNRKSRSKYKTRHQKSRTPRTVTTSSSSSSDKSTAVNQHHGDHQEYLFSPVVQVQQAAAAPPPCTQEFYFPMMVNDHPMNSDQTVVSSTAGMLFTDLMMNHQYGIPAANNINSKSKGLLEEEDSFIKTLTHSTPPPPVEVPSSVVPTSTINDVQGDDEEGGITRGKKLIVFINDVPFEVGSGGFNVKEAFGGDTVLIDSCGQSVATNDSGVTTHQSLKNGACYYLMRPFTHDHHAATTIDHLI